MDWYPLKFIPVFKEKPWGGRRLQDLFGKPLPPGRIGESWEVSAHPEGETVVAEGPMGGRSLARLAREHPEELLGSRIAGRWDRFPLLIKLLDANEILSVQVHPDDEYAASHTDDLGKEECWFVLHVGENGRIFKGLRREMTPEEFSESVRSKKIAGEFNSFRPNVGDMVFIPARTLHTVTDIVFAEVQQSSDLTYRVYDWDRVGADGKGRPLHLDEALAVARMGPPEENAVTPERIDESTSLLVDADKFRVVRVRTAEAMTVEPSPGSFRVLIFTGGYGKLAGSDYRMGDCVVLPAALDAVTVEPRAASDYLLVEPR